MSTLLAAAELAYLGALAAVAGAWLLWPLGLAALARARRPPAPVPLPDDALPALAVLVPTLNESARIDARLDDLARSDYPRERLRVVVVDGGSCDGTAERVRTRAAADPSLQLVALPGSRSKTEQLAAGLAACDEEFVAATDADVTLAPDALRRLVEVLCADPRTGAVGAWLEPGTPLAEERLHWALVNRLWRLEGEALGAAMFSGACYALRARAAEPPPPDAVADDAHLVHDLLARGWSVRLLRSARARELRVPRSARELVAYRRRRGAAYLHELRRARSSGRAGAWRYRLVRAMRRLQLEWAPRAAGVAVVLAPLLLVASPRRAALALAAGAVVAPALLALGALAAVELRAQGARAVLAAPLRLLALEALALATLVRRRSHGVQPAGVP